MADDLPVLTFASAEAFAAWLEAEGSVSAGAWLRLAKKGTEARTVTYADALDAALCHGWIDGHKRALDETFWLQRFTPRRHRSRWSKANRERAEHLLTEGRMREGGRREIERAQADGRWQAAYDGARTASVPDDLTRALAACPAAAAAFAGLDAANRYAVLYRIAEAGRPRTRADRIERLVAMLARGEVLHPPRSALARRGERAPGQAP